MTVPTNFKAGISARGLDTKRWLEIAGIPICYGSFAANSTWFSARAASDQFLEIRPYFKQGEVPANFDGSLDPLDGVASVMGQVEFTIGDIDGIPTSWTGNAKKSDWVYLSADITATATTLGYTGIASGFPASNGTIYLGAETITYTALDTIGKQFTGCARGRYRSKAKAFGAGFPLSPRPYAIKGRQAWYYQLAQAKGTTAVDADKAARFVGTWETFRSGDMIENAGSYILGIQSIEKKLTKEVFRNLRTFRDDAGTGISSPPWTDPGTKPATQSTPGTIGPADLRSSDYALLADFEVICARVEDEIVGVQRKGAAFNVGWRNRFHTAVATHKPGCTLKEVAWIASYNSQSGDIEHAQTKFTSTPTVASPLPADHPLIVLLQVILSTGKATNTPGGGARNYDVLPESWGLGIDYSRIDIAGIEKLAGEFGDLRCCGVIEQSMKFTDFAQKLLRPFGFYALTTLGDSWTIRVLRPPDPDEVTRVLDDSIRISGSAPSFEGNLSGLVEEIVFNYGLDLTRNVYRFVVVNTLGDVKLYSASDTGDQGDGRRISFDMPFYYPAGVALPGKPPVGGMPNLDLRLRDRGEFFKQRYARPPPIIGERANYSFLDVEVGDLVSNTHTYLPNAGTAARGLAGSLQQVIKKSVDDRSKTVVVSLLDTGYPIGDYRFISPALHIQEDDAQNFWVFANDYTEPTIGGLTQNDMQVRDNSGALVNTFAVGQKVRVWLPDFSAFEHHVIAYFTTANVGNFTTPAFGTVAGVGLAGLDFVVTYDDYDTDTNINGVKSTYGWMADSGDQLGAAHDPSHKLSP